MHVGDRRAYNFLSGIKSRFGTVEKKEFNGSSGICNPPQHSRYKFVSVPLSPQSPLLHRNFHQWGWGAGLRRPRT